MSSIAPSNLRRLLVAVAVMCLAAGGCETSGDGMVHVSGTLTFDGGPPPEAGVINFQSVEAADGFRERPGYARFGTDGAFEATSIREGDGLTPGEYLVVVTCNSGPPDPNSPTAWEDVSYIASTYEPKNLLVEPDSDAIQLDLNVPLKKK